MRNPPSKPWCRIGVDIFQHAGCSYLCAYDAHSNYPEVEKLRDTSAETVVNSLAAMFARYGIPLEVLTDNGPQFSSHLFTNFADRYDFKHTTSSPGFPQSNGLAEKGVQVVKRILKKTAATQEDFWLGLLAYRTAPLEDGRSPAELLMGRYPRTRIPDFGIHSDLPVYKRVQVQHHLRHLTPLNEGDVVRVQGTKGWTTKATVTQPVAPRSYQVQSEAGQVFRRNRLHLLPTQENFQQQDDPADMTSEREVPAEMEVPAQQAAASQDSLPSNNYETEGVGSRIRPQRNVRPPSRLHYGHRFEQVS